jgi:hypothetical protein
MIKATCLKKHYVNVFSNIVFAMWLLNVTSQISFFRTFKGTVLPDIVLDNVPIEWNKYSYLPDISVIVCLCLMIYLIFVHLPKQKVVHAYYIPEKYQVHLTTYQIFCHIVSVYILLIYLRSLLLLLTSVPDPSPKCQQIIGKQPLSFFKIDYMYVLKQSISGFPEITCGDMIFSGHTLIYMITGMSYHTYFKQVPFYNLTKIFVFIFCGISSFSLIVTHMHYTIDVILACLFSIFIWIGTHNQKIFLIQ